MSGNAGEMSILEAIRLRVLVSHKVLPKIK